MRTFAYGIFLSYIFLFNAARGLNRTVCPGQRVSILDLAEFDRRGCNVIEGSLILYSATTCFPDEVDNVLQVNNSLPITPLSSVVEITGTLVVIDLEELVDNVGQILPNLAVVRGNPYIRFPEINAGISISNNKYLKSINLTKLTHLLGDSRVFIWNNQKIQFIRTVDWKRISSGGSDAFFLKNAPQRETCLSNCGHCWNADTCQIALKDGCWSTDAAGNCTACHKECLSFCIGPGDTDCISCRHFYYQGKCVASCPNGTVAVAGWRCLERCPDVKSEYSQTGRRYVPTFAFNGQCREDCPQDYAGDIETRTCVPCNGTNDCRKRCAGRAIRSINDAKDFKGCRHVEGSLTINILTDSDEEGKMKEYLGSVEQVDGYVLIVNSYMLRTLDFLDNLISINGDTLWKLGSFYYGLAVVSNRNLKSVKWKALERLRLGGRIDVKVLLAHNYLLCQDEVKELKRLFPCAVHDFENSILAVCNLRSLNVTVSRSDNFTTDLIWDPVPLDNQPTLIGYRILWRPIGITGSGRPLPDPYDDNNPERCNNTGWRFFTIENRTSYRLDDRKLPPWHTTVFQVRAEFAQRDVDFWSDLLRVDGYQAVPSCPTIIKLHPDQMNVSIAWSAPKDYTDNVTHYVIAVTEQSTGVVMSNSSCSLGNMTLDRSNQPCRVNNATSRIPPPCMKGVREVDVKDVCSFNSKCQTTVSGLRTYFWYKIEIQARNPAGCGFAYSDICFTRLLTMN